MKPYYQDDYVTLYHADCLEHLDLLDQADVMVTDPPYGVAYQSGWVKREAIRGDNDLEARDTILKAWGDKPAIVFGSWRKPRPAATKHRLIWSKGADPGMGDLKMPWGNSDEEIYVMGAGWEGQRSSNVLTYPKPPISTRPDHPTPKPVPLMERLITAAPPVGKSSTRLLVLAPPYGPRKTSDATQSASKSKNATAKWQLNV